MGVQIIGFDGVTQGKIHVDIVVVQPAFDLMDNTVKGLYFLVHGQVIPGWGLEGMERDRTAAKLGVLLGGEVGRLEVWGTFGGAPDGVFSKQAMGLGVSDAAHRY